MTSHLPAPPSSQPSLASIMSLDFLAMGVAVNSALAAGGTQGSGNTMGAIVQADLTFQGWAQALFPNGDVQRMIQDEDQLFQTLYQAYTLAAQGKDDPALDASLASLCNSI
jgi:hypothetical protein